MEIIIFATVFLIGTIFGSFFTLAVYRIPRGENIIYGRSHCTTCNHRLNFWDLIPVLSYVFLGGKCRYCGEKIRIRYLLLEIFSGLVFLMVALTHGIDNIVNLCFFYLFFASMFIIGGIDKEKYIIPDSLCIYGFCIASSHCFFNYINNSIYIEYIIGATLIPVLFLIINLLICYVKKDKSVTPIGYGDIKYLAIIGLMFGYKVQIVSIIISLIIAFIGYLIHKYKEIPWGFYLTISTIIIVTIEPYMMELFELM